MNVNDTYCSNCGQKREILPLASKEEIKGFRITTKVIVLSVIILLVCFIALLTTFGLGRPAPPDCARSFMPGLTQDYNITLLNRNVRGRAAIYTYRVTERNRLNSDNWFWQMTDGEGIVTLEWDTNNRQWTSSGWEWTRREYTDQTMELLEGRWSVFPLAGNGFFITISNVTETSATIEWEHGGDWNRSARINGELFGTAEVTIRLVEGRHRYYVFDGIVVDAIYAVTHLANRHYRFYFCIQFNSFELTLTPGVRTVTGQRPIRRSRN